MRTKTLRPVLAEDVLALMGYTRMVRFWRVVDSEVAKLENTNSAGSVKDRIAINQWRDW